MDVVRWVVTLGGIALIAAVNAYFFLRPRVRAAGRNRTRARRGEAPGRAPGP